MSRTRIERATKSECLLFISVIFFSLLFQTIIIYENILFFFIQIFAVIGFLLVLGTLSKFMDLHLTFISQPHPTKLQPAVLDKAAIVILVLFGSRLVVFAFPIPIDLFVLLTVIIENLTLGIISKLEYSIFWMRMEAVIGLVSSTLYYAVSGYLVLWPVVVSLAVNFLTLMIVQVEGKYSFLRILGLNVYWIIFAMQFTFPLLEIVVILSYLYILSTYSFIPIKL